MVRFFTILFISISTFLYAQEDSYHANLKTMPLSKYGITGETWILSASEISNYSNATSGWCEVVWTEALQTEVSQQFLILL